MEVLIGIDVGQKVDPTAIAVVERQPRDGEEHHLVRHLERLPLQTAYPRVAERLTEVVDAVRAKVERRTVSVPFPLDPFARKLAYVSEVRSYEPQVRVYVDATGVGQPVVDLLEVAGVRPTACYFTHGDRRTEEAGAVKIGKAWLVSRLQALLQTGRLHLPRTAEAQALAEELLVYEIRVDEDGNDRYGAFKVGRHDDMVTALGLAVQQGGPRWGCI